MSFLVEYKCPKHGFERFEVPIIKRQNVNSKTIMFKYREKPKSSLSGIIVGRNVDYTEVRDYLIKYFKEAGMMEHILKIEFKI